MKHKNLPDDIKDKSLTELTEIASNIIENLENKKILIIAEQGIGDLIQFTRYLYKLKSEYNVEIILYLKSNKFSHFFKKGDFKIISQKEKIQYHDFHNHILSLLSIFAKKDDIFNAPTI